MALVGKELQCYGLRSDHTMSIVPGRHMNIIHTNQSDDEIQHI